MQKGLFITFEGIDGCGKTTQINLLDEYLKNKKYTTVLTLEPGGSDIGKSLREILLHHKGFVDDTCELLLYLADRAQHTKTVIESNINKGNIVLCDRYTDSTLAYQGYARGGDIDKINLLNSIATGGIKPDITFLFDIDTQTAQSRVGNNKDRMESENNNFHKKVREGYLQIAENNERIKVINSEKSINEIFEEVKSYIDKLL